MHPSGQTECGPPTLQPNYSKPTPPTRILFLPFPPEGPATTSAAERKEGPPGKDIAATILYPYLFWNKNNPWT